MNLNINEKNRVGEKIKAFRVDAGLSVSETARKLEVSRQSVINWEKGKNVPSPELMYRLCDLFGVSIEQLLCKSLDRTADCKDKENSSTQSTEYGSEKEETKTCDNVRSGHAAKVEEIKHLRDQIEDIKTQTSNIKDGIDISIRRHKIITTVLLTIICLIVMLVVAFAIVLLIPIISSAGNKSFISLVSFGGSSAYDVLLLVGIISGITATGIIAGIIYAKKHPIKKK